MNWFNKLLAENGAVSMVRLLSLICVVTASVLAFAGIYSTTHSLESVSMLCGTFLTAGLTAKVMQKKMEISQIETTKESVQNEDKK